VSILSTLITDSTWTDKSLTLNNLDVSNAYLRHLVIYMTKMVKVGISLCFKIRFEISKYRSQKRALKPAEPTPDISPILSGKS
jgi:hypothetical protein